jgi:hypothetical protein
MNKVVEALRKLLPEDQIKEVAEAIDEMLEEAHEEIVKQKEDEFNKELEEAYGELKAELAKAEQIGEQGYEEAYALIADLRNRLEIQKEEFENTLEEGYEEAYQHLLSERAKNNSLEVDLYEQYEKKYGEVKEFFVEMIDQFLNKHGKEIYEQARRDVINDPRMLEHRVALDKILEIAADYLSDEDVALATSSKLEETHKKVEELTGQIKMMEARNIRLARDNEKLEECVRQGANLVTESRKHNKNERRVNGKGVSGRGEVVAREDTRVITEYSSEPTTSKKNTNKQVPLLESLGLNMDTLAILAGTVNNK